MRTYRWSRGVTATRIIWLAVLPLGCKLIVQTFVQAAQDQELSQSKDRDLADWGEDFCHQHSEQDVSTKKSPKQRSATWACHAPWKWSHFQAKTHRSQGVMIQPIWGCSIQAIVYSPTTMDVSPTSRGMVPALFFSSARTAFSISRDLLTHIWQHWNAFNEYRNQSQACGLAANILVTSMDWSLMIKQTLQREVCWS
jgi:hypothetical protein